MDLNNLLTHGVIRPNPFGWVLTPQDLDVVQKIVRRGGGADLGLDDFERIKRQQPKEYDDFIRVVCKVNGIDYEDTKKKRKSRPEITVGQMKFTIDTVLSEANTIKVHTDEHIID